MHDVYDYVILLFFGLVLVTWFCFKFVTLISVETFSILSKFQRTKAVRLFSKSTQSVAKLFNFSRHQI